MCLCVVFQQFQVMFLTELTYLVCVCTTSIEVHQHDAFGVFGDGLLYQVVVNLKGVYARFHQYRNQAVGRNR